MADFTTSKDGPGRVAPENAIAVQWEDQESLITPERLRTEHLLGIPLVSGTVNPITRKLHVVTDDEIKVFINNAVSLAQLESKIDIFPVQYSEKHAFDRVEYSSWGYFQLRHRPVSSIQELTVVVPSNTSEDTPIYYVPLTWVDESYLRQGQINILPLTIAMKSGEVVPLLATPGGSAMLGILGQQPWLPGFWRIKYVSGFKDGVIPKILNQYIGTIAAMELLAQLAASYARSTSTSLNIDGLGQSISGPGADLYTPMLKLLSSKRNWLMTRLKALFGLSIINGNV